MPISNWKQNIKYFVIDQIGSYARTSKFSWLKKEVIPIDENTLDEINVKKIKLITKLVFAVLNNINGENAGNKTAIIKYIQTLQEENKKYKSGTFNTKGGWLKQHLEEIIIFIQKNMVDNSIADLILLPDDTQTINIGHSLIKIASYLWVFCQTPFTSNQTSQHRFDTGLEAIMSLFSSRNTQYDRLQELRKRDLDYAIKCSEYSPRIDDSNSLRGAINDILKFYECMGECLKLKLPNVIINLMIDYLIGESFSYIKCEESKIVPEPALIQLIDDKQNHYSPLFSSIASKLNTLQDYVSNRLLFYQQSPPGLFNQVELFADLKKFLFTLKPLMESENSAELTRIIQREIMITIGNQSKFTEEYPQWHNYQTYMNHLTDILHLLKELTKNQEPSGPARLGNQ